MPTPEPGETPAGPSPRRAVGAAALDGAFYAFGGFGVRGTVEIDDVSADLWRWDGQWRRLTVGGPPAARYSSLVEHDGMLYLFGGCGTEPGGLYFHDEIWRFDGGWDRVEASGGSAPLGRYTAALACRDGALTIFGGHAQDRDGGKVFFDDLWRFEFAESRWHKLDTEGRGPGRRYGFGWVGCDNVLYVFGGFDGDRDRADLWALDLDTLRWDLRAPENDAVGPSARYCPALGMVDGRLVLFGGRSKTHPKVNFEDCWVFDGHWSLMQAPGPGYHAKPGYASNGSVLWLFGGEGPHGHVGDLWKFDHAGWTLLHKSPLEAPVLW